MRSSNPHILLRNLAWILLFSGISGIVPSSCFSQSGQYVDLLWKADSLYNLKKYEAALPVYRQLCKLPEARRGDLYHTAGCYANVHQPDSAFLYLHKALELGLRTTKISYFDQDSSFFPLHRYVKWKKCRKTIMDNVEVFYLGPKTNDLFKQCLVQMEKEDENLTNLTWATYADTIMKRIKIIRNDSFYQVLKNVRAGNASFLKEIVNRFGWPGYELVGEEGEFASWYIIQHADFDTTFQKECLSKMRSALLAYDILPAHYAYLQDRILNSQHKAQIYGTQFSVTKENSYEPLDYGLIQDPRNVNKRRHAMGMGTLEEYREYYLKQLNNKEASSTF